MGSSIPTAFGELPLVDDEGKLVENFTASAEPTEVYSVLRSKLTIERLLLSTEKYLDLFRLVRLGRAYLLWYDW